MENICFLDVVYVEDSDDIYLDKQVTRFYLDDIDRLARKAITLEPIAEVDKTLGYIGALGISYRDSEEEDAKLFNQIQNSFMAKKLLIDNVNIASMERDLRLYGTEAVNLDYYKAYLDQFKKDFEYAKTLEKNYTDHRKQ